MGALPADHRSPNGHTFALRRAVSFEELDRCVALQQEVWTYPDREVVPRSMFVLASALGGHVVGAWDEDGALAGFAMAVAAHQPGEKPGDPPVPYLHSHMLAVAAGYRNRGLGRALKLRQREEALARGITRMRWTFDPSVAKNAFFNLARLRATARVYLPDFYGRREGVPTDRLLAEWRLDGEAALPVTEAALRVQVPAAGQKGQAILRARLAKAFAEGWAATGFEPRQGGGGDYLLSRPGI